jgi:hypothetical protein
MQRPFVLPVVSGVVGVTVAHGLSYALAFPSTSGPSAAAHAAGHGYWHHAGDFAVLAAGVAVLLAAARGLAPDRSGRAGFRTGLAQAVGWQISLFTCLEAAERVAAGGSVVGLPGEPVFWIGVVVQALTAAVVLALLTGIEEIVATAVRVRRTRWRRPGPVRLHSLAVLPPASAPLVRAISRGPPCRRT